MGRMLWCAHRTKNPAALLAAAHCRRPRAIRRLSVDRTLQPFRSRRASKEQCDVVLHRANALLGFITLAHFHLRQGRAKSHDLVHPGTGGVQASLHIR